MIAFKVSHNGKPVCTAGVDDPSVLTTVISSVRHEPQPTLDPSMPEEELTMDVSGMPLPIGDQRIWNCPQLAVGDIISIEIVQTDHIDPPDEVKETIVQTDLEDQQP